MLSYFRSSFLQQVAYRSVLFVLPPRCLACDDLVGQEGGLCGVCWSDMAFIERPICDRTGRPLAYDLGGLIVSAEALANPPLFRKMRAAVRHEGTARRLILALKYHDRLDLARTLGRYMVRAGSDILAEADVIIPVPLHHRRLFQRRFNQSAELARAIASETGISLELEALKRIRATRPQTSLDGMAREKNVQGAFRVRSDHKTKVYDKRIVLIDDVMTTGATVEACIRTLLREKARHVDVLTFAKVVDGDKTTI